MQLTRSACQPPSLLKAASRSTSRYCRWSCTTMALPDPSASRKVDHACNKHHLISIREPDRIAHDMQPNNLPIQP